MSKRTLLSPHKALYALEDAAKTLGCTLDELLRFGATGQLQLCLLIPDTISVFAVDKAFLPGGRWHDRVGLDLAIELVLCQGPLREDRLATLTLDAQHCREVEATGKATAHAFANGGSFVEDYRYLPATPYDRLDAAENRPRRLLTRRLNEASPTLIEPWPHSRLFVTYLRDSQLDHPGSASMGTPIDVEMAFEAIYVEVGELTRFSKASVESSGRQKSPFNVSEKLTQLNRAAEEFWGHDARTKDGYPPKNTTVEAYLIKKKWAPDLAKIAAPIIRLKSTDTTNELLDKPKQTNHISSALAALNAVAKEYWCDIDLKDFANHPTNEFVGGKLKDIYGFGPMRAEAGARIIRPAGNKGGRLPRPKPATQSHMQKGFPRG